MVAGETSGDIHAGNLVAEILRLRPDVKVWAVGGARLKGAGAEIIFDSNAISAMGLAEAAAKLPALARARKAVLSGFYNRKPDIFVPVDFGGFNLRLAAEAKKSGIPVIYYIPPKAWAWGKKRVRHIQERVEEVLPVLPFEHDFWLRHGVKSRYVGSPVKDHLRPRRFSEEADTIGLLPGSRVGEVSRIWPKLAEAARIIADKRKARFLVARAEGLPEGMPDRSLVAGLECEFVEGDSQAVMERSKVVIVASGTATLECALVGVPMVVVYRMNPVTLAIARRVVSVDVISLPNLVAGERIVPELIQTSGAEIAREALAIADDCEARDAQKRGLLKVFEKVGPAGASERAARIILNRLEEAVL